MTQTRRHAASPPQRHPAAAVCAPGERGFSGCWYQRPRAAAFGADAYRNLDAKAAALLHSLARNHALADGSKRLALAALIAFYSINGRRLTLTNDGAYDLVMRVAAGELDTVDDIAAILRNATQPRP